MLEVIRARHVHDYTVWLEFNNGKSGEIDLECHLWGAAFSSLKDINVFRKFTVSDVLGTITWENEADFSPEFLLSNLI